MSTSKKDDKKIITYDEGSAVLIFTEDDEIRLLLPDMADVDDEDIIPDHIVIMTALATKLSSDEDFRSDLIKWYEGYLDHSKVTERMIPPMEPIDEENMKWN
jgi:hypothetical protein